MEHHLGEGYAESWARHQSIAALGGRTVRQALDEGEDAKRVWRAVCEVLGLPARER
jgi:Protein of unknown function (DUF3046)